jgi:glyoxylase-like metal-dependent hydrolase (beta-lactamase superfamily II)
MTSTDAIRLHPLDGGRVTVAGSDWADFADDGAYDGRQTVLTLPVPSFLVRHPKGDLMWDTGMSPTRTDLGEGATPGPSLVDQLRELGVAPNEIRFLALSHGHWDHSGNAGRFARSTWIVNPLERDAMFDAESRASQAMDDYGELEGVDTLLISEDHDLFGDGSVVIIQAPGHTPGHVVLLVRLPDAGPVLLSGDLWHMSESRRDRHVPTFNTDRGQTLASMDRVEDLAASVGARVIVQHEPADFEALPRFPHFLG